jgi:signal recognition particle receptor subunit beta
MTNSQHIILTAVAGAPGAGKSTFIRTLGAPADSAALWAGNRFGESPPPGGVEAADVGVVAADACAAVYLCEIPFFGVTDAVCRGLTEFVDGYVVLFDSTRPQSCAQARRIVDYVESVPPGPPRIIVANKQDCAEALSPREVAYILALDGGGVPVLPCVATERDDVKRVLLELLGRFRTAGVGE